MKKRELFWILGTVTAVILTQFLLFGKQGFVMDGTVDINVHDTYLIFPSYNIFLLLVSLFFFVVYLGRILRRGFKNKTVNLVLIIAAIVLIVVVNGIHFILESLLLNTLSTVLFYIQIALLVLLAFIGFKTGQYHKK